MKSIAGWEDNREDEQPEGPKQSTNASGARAQQGSDRGAKAAAKKPARMYRTNLRDVPKVGGLKRKDGWVDMQVQFLIDKKSAGADHVVGWTVLKPGARHENHRHHNCDEFFIVLKGKGHIYTENGEQPSGEGDVVYSPRDVLARLQQHLERRRRAGVGLDGRRLDRGVRLRSRSRDALSDAALP